VAQLTDKEADMVKMHRLSSHDSKRTAMPPTKK
jgi:hypothetical protein